MVCVIGCAFSTGTGILFINQKAVQAVQQQQQQQQQQKQVLPSPKKITLPKSKSQFTQNSNTWKTIRFLLRAKGLFSVANLLLVSRRVDIR